MSAAAGPPPWPVPERVETRRLVLRPYAPEDGPALFEAVHESLDDLRPWMPWAPEHVSVEASVAACLYLRAAWHKGVEYTMGIFSREDGRLLGGSGLHRVQWDVPSFEIGYWVRSTARGRGYVTESTAGLARTCFEVLAAQRVEIYCDPENVASRRVAERVGFVLEGTLRRCRPGVDGRIGDRHVFALVRDDWAKAGPRISRIAAEGPVPG